MKYKLLKDTPTIKAGTIFEEVISDFYASKQLTRNEIQASKRHAYN
nr:MAG TPA: hypothetical protein [Caudoviricetes sp.]